MSDIKFLPDNKVSFDVEVLGEVTKTVYKGRFVMRLFLNLKQRSIAAVEFSKRDLGNIKDDVLSAVIKSITELQLHCEECPDWFRGEKVMDLVDLQPIAFVREQLDKAVDKFLQEQEK